MSLDAVRTPARRVSESWRTTPCCRRVRHPAEERDSVHILLGVAGSGSGLAKRQGRPEAPLLFFYPRQRGAHCLTIQTDAAAKIDASVHPRECGAHCLTTRQTLRQIDVSDHPREGGATATGIVCHQRREFANAPPCPMRSELEGRG